MARYMYRNTNTGATFESDVVCVGGNWEQVSAAKALEKPEAAPEPEAPKKAKKASK